MPRNISKYFQQRVSILGKSRKREKFLIPNEKHWSNNNNTTLQSSFFYIQNMQQQQHKGHHYI